MTTNIIKSALPISLMLVGALGATAFAQSSGNFAAEIMTAQCVLSSITGALSGGIAGNLMTTTIKTPNSNKTALLVRPSLVTGLYTNTFINTASPLSNRTAAVVVTVTFDGRPVAPETDSHPSVTFDERFQQISTGVFSAITECATGNPQCNFDLILGTLSAHSADFVVPDPGVGVHTLEVSWALVCNNGSGTPSASKCATTFTNNTAAACVGPGVLTLTQVKAFSQSGGIAIR